MFETLEDRQLLSSYFVAPWGNDGAAGTLAAPYKSIQRAANVANWGDSVQIRGGTYRETVTPAHSGVTFQNYNGESVTVSGADQVGGFTSNGNSIYSTSIGYNRGGGNNQVFVDGQLMNEARWPNTGLDPSHPNQAQIGSYSGNTIYNSSLNQPNGFWNGATIHISPGNGWVSYSGTVTNSGPGWISVSLPSLGSYEYPKSGNNFYLTGKQGALDAAGEAYIDGSSRLYLRDAQSDNPANHNVEVKRRDWAFNISNVSNTTIRGLNLFAATIHSGYSSGGTMIDGITAKYVNTVGWISNGWSVSQPWGIEMLGANSTIQNSNIGPSAGDGVYIGANSVTVKNNTIHDVDYAATDAAGVRVYGQYSTIQGNTIYNAGRDGINFQVPHVNILYNTIHDVMLQTTDGGGIYTVNTNGQGSQIVGNTIYNVTAGGWGGAGIFLDNYTSNVTVHDNNVWNVNHGIKLNFTSYNEQVYNNKFSAYNYSVANNGTYSWGGSSFHNNTFVNPNVQWGSGVSQYANTYGSGSSTPTPAPAPTPTPTQTGSTSTGTWAGNTYQALNNIGGAGVAKSGNAVGYTSNGSWIVFKPVDFGTGNFSKFIANLAVGAGYAGQKIVVHVDSLTGPTIATLVTGSTGSWGTYQDQSTALSKITGVHSLYIQFVGSTGIANLQSFRFA